MGTNHGKTRTRMSSGAVAPAAPAVLVTWAVWATMAMSFASGAGAHRTAVGLSPVLAQGIANQTIFDGSLFVDGFETQDAAVGSAVEP
ncbi:MAG: hypothetical protein ABIV06_07385 [Thermoanaerobaculia bacterium]